MRVPHTIPANTLRAYEASYQTLALQMERDRIIRSEFMTWDELEPPALVAICVQVLAANFVEHSPAILYFTFQDYDYLLEILPVTLPLIITIPIIPDGLFWQRSCISKWPNRSLDVSKYEESWKRMYIERFCEEYIECQEPGYIDWEDVNEIFDVCKPFIQRLVIKELKPPREWGPPLSPPDPCTRGRIDPDHMDLRPILKQLNNMTEFSIRFDLIDCGMDYNPECFRVSVTDITNLGEGLKVVKSLRKFRIHRSAIEDIKVNILIKALLSCESLEELEISHCQFGNIGAKSLSKLLTEHTQLKSLSIQNNKIGQEGASSIAFALQHPTCSPIQIINLEFNIIGDKGAIDLSTAIVKNKTLKELYLGGVGMTSVGATKIAEALLFNNRIQIVTLSNNHLGTSANDHLIAAVQKNKRIQTLDVRSCGIGELTETTIHTHITQHRLRWRPT